MASRVGGSEGTPCGACGGLVPASRNHTQTARCTSSGPPDSEAGPRGAIESGSCGERSRGPLHGAVTVATPGAGGVGGNGVTRSGGGLWRGAGTENGPPLTVASSEGGLDPADTTRSRTGATERVWLKQRTGTSRTGGDDRHCTIGPDTGAPGPPRGLCDCCGLH